MTQSSKATAPPPPLADTPPEPVPAGSSEPGVVPPSVVGTSQDPNKVKVKE